jgi:hypothetical protein
MRESASVRVNPRFRNRIILAWSTNSDDTIAERLYSVKPKSKHQNDVPSEKYAQLDPSSAYP